MPPQPGVALQLHAALVRLALDRALLFRQPVAALPVLQHAELILRVQNDAPLTAESFRTNRPFARYGVSGPVTWIGRSPSFRRRVPVRVGRPNTAGRTRRQVRRAVRSGASRDGPGLDEPGPPARASLSRADRAFLKAEVDRLARQRLADEVVDKALFRAVQAWGSAEVVS